MTIKRFLEPPAAKVTPEPGVYTFGLDDEKRKALNFAPGLSSYSKLNKFAHPDKKISPFVAGVGNLVSDTLLFGREAVCGKYYFHDEQVKFNTKAGKQWRDDWKRNNPDMVLIRPKEYDEAQRLIAIALTNPEIMDCLNAPGYCEAGLVCDLDGMRFRSWVDKLLERAIVDVKTTRAASPEEFLSGVLKYQYDVQAALYCDQAEALGLGQLGYAWLVISKTSNRAWVEHMPSWAYHSGRRWRTAMIKAYLRETNLQDQIREILTG